MFLVEHFKCYQNMGNIYTQYSDGISMDMHC